MCLACFSHKVSKQCWILLIRGKPVQTAKFRVVTGALPPELANTETLQIKITPVVRLRPIVTNLGVGRPMPTSTKNNGFASAKVGQERALLIIHHHGLAHCAPVIFSKQPVHNFRMGVLDDIRNQLGRI